MGYATPETLNTVIIVEKEDVKIVPKITQRTGYFQTIK